MSALSDETLTGITAYYMDTIAKLEAEINVKNNLISDLRVTEKLRLQQLANKDAEIDRLRERIVILENTVKGYYENI